MRTCCPPFALTPRLAFPEMTCRAVRFPVPRVCEVAPVTLHFDDQFPSFREVDGLSDTAFRLHVTAFFWIRTNRTDGLIRTEDLALVCARVRASERFAAECVQRGAWHDARHDCGSRHCLGPVDVDGYVVHDYLKENPSKAQLEAEETGKSRGGKRGNHKRWHEDKGKTAPGCEFCEEAETRKTAPRKPSQKRTSHKRSHTDRISESHATPIDQSQDLDFDLDFDQSEGVGQSKSDARASDADDPELVTVVANAICAEASFLPGDDQARAVIKIFEERARKAGTVIRNKPAYYAKIVANEPDLWNGVLLPKPPPVVAEPASWAPPVAPAFAAWDPDYHEFAPLYRGAVCRCGSTENSPKHHRARNECLA